MTTIVMVERAKTTVAEKVANATSAFIRRQTGHAPRRVSVSTNGRTLVLTLHEALTPAEKLMARTAAGAAQVREFHRKLFAASSGALRLEIARITGMQLREATAKIEVKTGAVVFALTSDRVVEVYRPAVNHRYGR